MIKSKIKKTYDCSFDFRDFKTVKKYRYLVVTKGDLDINNAMLLRTKKDLIAWLEQDKDFSQRLEMIFEVRPLLNFQEPTPKEGQ